MQALGVARHAFQQEVGIARKLPALQHQGIFRDRRLEGLHAGPRLAGQLDQDERRHLIAQQPLVQGGADRPDKAAGEQRTDAPQRGRLGQADAARELIVADASVLLQLGQDFQVDGIERQLIGHR